MSRTEVPDGSLTWRIIYGIDSDAVVILEVFEKKSRTTPAHVVESARRRWRQYLQVSGED
jgi:phage-related protein